MGDPPKFRGNWTPQIADPTPWAPEVRRSSTVLERLAGSTPDTAADAAADDDPPVVVESDEEDEDATPLSRAERTVQKHKAKYPSLDRDALATKLIRSKSISTAIYGLITAGASIIPGFGALAALLTGAVVDQALTTKMQMDLSFELAALYDEGVRFEKDDSYRKKCLLLISGLAKADDGGDTNESEDENITHEAGKRIAKKTAEEFSKRSLLRLVPLIGSGVAGTTNLVATYVMGRRAQMIFLEGIHPGIPTWSESVKRYTRGSDENTLVRWVVESVDGRRMRALRAGIGSAKEFISKSFKKLTTFLSSQSAMSTADSQ